MREKLKQMDDRQLTAFIRDRLKFPNPVTMSVRGDNYEKEHYRFYMSGYDGGCPGQCTTHNQMVLNKFADCGIYDGVFFLTIEFYKGTPFIIYRYWDDYWRDQIDSKSESLMNVIELPGYGTVEIIMEVFKIAIFNCNCKRRRD